MPFLRMFAMLMALQLVGCGVWRPTPVPMRTLSFAARCDAKASTLLVFLPGSYSSPEDYLSHGFIDAVQGQHVAADIVLVDAHLGYYSERSILDRLRQDVLLPARADGYRDIWLVGISVGAYGALLHAATSEPGQPAVAGIVALAPYLGDRRVSLSVDAAGGLALWPLQRRLEPADFDVLLWQWLRGASRSQNPTRLYLGYGDSDRFAYSDRLLGAALPADHVVTAPGGHDWPVWQILWRRILPTLPLPRDSSCRFDAAINPLHPL